MKNPLLSAVRFIVLTLFLAIAANQSFAQIPAQGYSKISGIVLDSAAAKGVEFASIALFNVADNKAIDGTTADESGKFAISKVAPGSYKLMISFIGYKDKAVNVKVEKGKDVELGSIQLASSVQNLQEVTITGEKSLIEEKVDRMVFNAEKDITSKGGDASDLLRKVPMLSVDLDGNVSLRGSANIKVLINNKPSTIIAANVADALKQIPADMIKSVEVITSPSAKYDAEGSGGIINIITKKNNLQGLTLNIDSGVGNRGSNLGLNGSYRKGKMGFTLGGFGRAFYNKATSVLDQTTYSGSNSFLTNQSSTAKDRGLFGQYSLGWDYDLGKNQALSAGLRYGTRNFIQKQDLTINQYENSILNNSSLRKVDRKDLSGTVDFNIDYIRTFKPQQEWSISTLYSRTGLTNNFNTDILNESGAVDSKLKNENKNQNSELTLQTDYQTPLGKNQLFEFGAKGIFRTVDSDFKYLTAGESGNFVLSTTNPSGVLNYKQNVAAGYFSYTLSTKNKYTFKLGTRYEYTGITADMGDNKPIDIPAYGNLVPSINVSKVLSGSTTLKAAYNRRIQRPGIQQLNPNVNLANPQSISTGNPALSPELTDNFELGLSTNIKKTYINASVFARQTNNSITQVRMAVDTLQGAIVTTYENIGKQRAYGANVFANVYLTPKWTLNGSIDILHSYLEGQTTGLDGTSVGISNSGFNYGGRLMSQISLRNGWGLQAFGFYRGKEIQLQGTRTGFYMYSLGFKKDIANKKGSIGFGAENFLTKGVRFTSDLTSPQFVQTGTTQLYNRNFKVTFSYSIGKMSFNAPKKKTKSVNNTDVVGGGGQQN
ncbi:outer membrane receptor protein involved in Fe transport [Dyadobacter sp. BE34]|uniref:Outer membrane receptor protein involved in Fe transport n=2 Tax=Spirosomataceae TaxID=2896860 RepID=A0ABU1QSS6_9BACT|nr:outer membrane receptor protein involved in Fe transport [Dyadobacter fermentans]MDR7041941.1 outer membrane receptor protein involved in Fe transport [Dyadobacter sp. BE242]MDR7196344.1 outer membrane receptor protein involved in Fe transport [Dyadobacter sp. BE34]MDR7213111.1 outer membrane receptor protein involved in Fe transport [Dyadobacter sp. BE31]MDR7261750.1 outer membrane receptor protein involved in Fe transport [Dyadobacter sp. BE32]